MRVRQRGALLELALLADHLRQARELVGHHRALLDEIVEHLGDLAEGAGAVIGQAHLRIAALQLRERGEDHRHLVGLDDGVRFVGDGGLVHATPSLLVLWADSWSRARRAYRRYQSDSSHPIATGCSKMPYCTEKQGMSGKPPQADSAVVNAVPVFRYATPPRHEH